MIAASFMYQEENQIYEVCIIIIIIVVVVVVVIMLSGFMKISAGI